MKIAIILDKPNGCDIFYSLFVITEEILKGEIDATELATNILGAHETFLHVDNPS